MSRDKHMSTGEINHCSDDDELIKALTANRRDQQTIQHELDTYRNTERALVARLYALRFPQKDNHG